MSTTIQTKYGNASEDSYGYYRIHSNEKGNRGEYLHRLIFQEFYGKIPKGFHIHHKNGNRKDNCILNLQLIRNKDHSALHKPSKETKEKMSKAHRGKNNPMYGKKHTNETLKKMSESHQGENHPLYGKHLSEEWKQKISETKKGTTLTKEHKIKTSKTMNSTGYYRVTKSKQKNAKQGFYWVYKYYEDGKRRAIYATTIEKLKKKVLDRGFEWIEFIQGDENIS